MKRSDILYGILIFLFTALVVLVFTFPQDTLDDLEIYFLWIIMPVLGLLWIRAYLDGIRGK